MGGKRDDRCQSEKSNNFYENVENGCKNVENGREKSNNLIRMLRTVAYNEQR